MSTEVADAAGTFFAGVFGIWSKLRRSPKVLHPVGSVVTATMHRQGTSSPVGIDWIDAPGSDEVQLRFSRSLGLRDPLPDFLGLAVRIPFGDAHGDLLLTTTGRGSVSRFLLVPQRDFESAFFCTMMPYTSASGSLVFGATTTRRDGRIHIDFQVARPRGEWQSFATIDVDEPAVGADGADGPDQPISFDPVLNVPAGLRPYEWVSRLRERSYAVSRRSRGAAIT